MGSQTPKIPLRRALVESKPRTPTATGSAKSRWWPNLQHPAEPGVGGWPVDAAAPSTLSDTEGTGAAPRDPAPVGRSEGVVRTAEGELPAARTPPSRYAEVREEGEAS
ncbi:hypothetical protein NDU88_001826 [Pleurodeles waltl]|uniref:Uncharacterized protein n=1 Tax=Pleurodeles waltl TaxID=8319 RepID=A0AAV7S8H1_PLEWA|nr:hypothetical protein NDU88_001826 [Pleurodeles waltl]